VRVRGGRIDSWRQFPGYFGVPVIAVDGTTAGVSRDGRTLVLATPSGPATSFAVLDTRTWKLRRVALRGPWSYDAISPDGGVLYLVQYSRVALEPSYRVRAYDVKARRLLARPIVDRTVGERLMRGLAVTRKSSADGRWAYTLYARSKKAPFVHALDTVQRRAFCIDLPLDLRRSKQTSLRLGLADERTLVVRQGRKSVAAIDTETLAVHRH
jgi:hypothetical protein